MPTTYIPLLSPDKVEEFRTNGAVILRQVFEQKWVEAVREGIEENLRNPSAFSEALKGDEGEGKYFDDYCNWTRIKEFEDFVYNSPAAQIACELMESNTSVFYHEHVLVKEPQSSKETPWHHDQPYYPIDGNKVCSIWMPVDPVPLNRCVKFVSGSHLGDRWYIPRKFATSMNYENEKDITKSRQYLDVPEVDSKKDKILQWEVQPGDCIVFHMRTLHGAPGNMSENTSRRVLSTRWLGEDATIADRPWTTSPPILGGLKIGDKAVSSDFPLIFTKN